jgi:hypothetical protein
VLYGSAEYILWKIKSGTLPSATTAVPAGLISVSATDTVVNQAGMIIPGLGATQATILPVSIATSTTFGAGGQGTEIGAQNGGRFTLGWWADSDMTWGGEVQFFFTERASDDFAVISSSGSSNPFLIDTGLVSTQSLFVPAAANVQAQIIPLGNPIPIVVAREARSSLVGTINYTALGAEINGRCVGLRYGYMDFGGLVGFRWFGFREELSLVNNVQLSLPAGVTPPPGDANASLSRNLIFTTADRLRIWNNFYGGQVGFDIDSKWGPIFLYTRAKLALGTMVQQAYVEGATTVTNLEPTRVIGGVVTPTTPPTGAFAGGLLSGPGDQGSHTRTKFSWIPELNAKLGYQVNSWLRGWVGYDAIYIGHVARTGTVSVVNQLNTTVQIAGATQQVSVSQPGFRFRDQDIWIQGLNFGFEVNY